MPDGRLTVFKSPHLRGLVYMYPANHEKTISKSEDPKVFCLFIIMETVQEEIEDASESRFIFTG